MTEKIEPALSAEEWRGRAIERGEEFQGEGIGASVDPVLGFVVDNFTPETQSSHDDPRSLAAIIALANAALPDSDPRKIAREWVQAIRNSTASLAYSETDGATWTTTQQAQTADQRHRVLLSTIADALESYLPPE